MLQLNNETPFKAALDIFYDAEGLDTLIVTVKATFLMTSPVTIAEEQSEPSRCDEYWGDPGVSSIKQGCDVTLLKSATDIIMTGNACAPDGKKVQALDVQLAVGDIEKTVRVIGDRVWEKGIVGLNATEPEPFASMPLVYERAYGGVHELEKKTLAEPRNPVGQSFKGKRSKKELAGQPLPNLEHPKQLMTIPDDTPEPVCFGWVAPSWAPRHEYAGTYDAAWEKNRAPYLPDDFDLRFFQAAPEDLISTEKLVGGERVAIKNMSPEGDINFQLPTLNFAISAEFNNSTEVLDMQIATVHLQPNENQFSMVFHGALDVNKRRLDCKVVNIKTTSIEMYDT
jgi:hypothetical protein